MSNVLLKSVPPKNINAQLVELLGHRIIQGHYKVGQQLPVEAALCEEFGVSRPIMREATKILSAKGLLASRPRVGTIVRPRNNWNMLDSDVLAWVTESLAPVEFLDMLFEARLSIEPSAAALAAQKATSEDLAAIKSALDDMAQSTCMEATIEPDIRFHQAIMDATHNDVIRYVGHTLHNALTISISLTNWHPDIHAKSLPRHHAVYAAIAKKLPGEAAAAASELLVESRLDFDAKKEPENPHS